MGGTSNDFGKNISAFADALGKKSWDCVRAFAFGVFSEVIKRTPVDSGRMRGNWQASTGSPNYSEIDRADKSGSSAISAIMPNLDGIGNFYLTNNLPYAARREQEGGKPVKNATRTQFGIGKGGGFIDEIIERREDLLRKAVNGG